MINQQNEVTLVLTQRELGVAKKTKFNFWFYLLFI